MSSPIAQQLGDISHSISKSVSKITEGHTLKYILIIVVIAVAGYFVYRYMRRDNFISRPRTRTQPKNQDTSSEKSIVSTASTNSTQSTNSTTSGTIGSPLVVEPENLW